MEIQKPKSHSPEIHDNTEKEIIFVPPSVLLAKLQDFEGYSKAIGSIWSDLGVAITLLAAIATTNFNDIGNFSGQSIRGAFITGLLFMLIRIGNDAYKIFTAKTRSKTDVVQSLLNKATRSLEEKNNKK